MRPDTCAWQFPEAGLEDDARLVDAVREVHASILAESFADESLINGALQIQCRAFRRVGPWRMLLVLTPWMLARLLFPEREPDLAIPEGWAADQRRNADYQVLGPAVEINMLSQPLKVHLGYHVRLGHYLLHPLCLNMQGFEDGEAVFEAWNDVIRTRDANLERLQSECPMHQEVSRRELFRRYRD